ncbi:MAG: hypothetical protein K2H43_02770, partial [Clostridia bacterium]|nr:hypothetical protein [Clostridia bacterium]
IAPGHNSFTKSPDGTEDWIVYHSTKVYQDTISRAGWDRLVRYQKLSWKDDAPYLEYYPYFSEEIPVPSGEKTKKYVYEAEKATLTDGCIIVDSTDEYKGTKYEFASGGKSVRLTGEEDTLTFNVNVKQSGRYVLQVRWANKSDVEAISVTVNGKETNLYAPKSNSYNCFMTNGFYTDLYVRDNRPNEVVIKCDRNILIDCIIVDYLDR